MNQSTPPNSCRLCGATSYRHVIARDGDGAMRPTGLYQCSRCSVVFADPKAWREGVDEAAPLSAKPAVTPLTPFRAGAVASAPAAPRSFSGKPAFGA